VERRAQRDLQVPREQLARLAQLDQQVQQGQQEIRVLRDRLARLEQRDQRVLLGQLVMWVPLVLLVLLGLLAL